MRDALVEVDDRVYQRKSGKLYIDSDEFIRSEEGQRLLDRLKEDGGDEPEGYDAAKLEPGQCVQVECDQYEGLGTVSTDTHYGSHLVHLGEDHAGQDRGLYVAVRIPNDNVHLYPANAVRPADSEQDMGTWYGLHPALHQGAE